MMLAALLATDADERLGVLDDLTLDVPGAAHAVRQVLLADADATVRAAAAAFIERTRALVVAPALVDALYDTHPSVRMAASRAAAKLGVRAALPVLRRLALEEPIWWVRRAAVLAVARLDRADALPLLRDVLDDPFWRVRHAAVRVLVALGDKLGAEAITASTQTGSERAEGALRYLERRLGRLGAQHDLPGSTPTPTSPGLVADHDPAVVAARLEQGHRATPAELALYLGDPHASLRAAAARRLRAVGSGRRGSGSAPDVRALLAASWWLEEPRIPHATATVVRLLDSLGPEVEDLLDALLAEPDARPGAAAWALSFIAIGERWDRLEHAFAAMRATAPIVRRVATSTLSAFVSFHGAHDEQRTAGLALLRAALSDADEDVRRLAVHGLVFATDAASWATVLALPFLEQPTLVRRLLVLAAREMGDVATLRFAAGDADPETSASGLAALHHAGLLEPAERAAARASADPWVRASVLETATLLDVLRMDPDPGLKRAAFELATRERGLALEAARIAERDDDRWLRVHAAERLARSPEDADLRRVLLLSRDPDAAVRAAAADVLSFTPSLREGAPLRSDLLPERLARAQTDVDPIVRAAADTWLGLRAPQLIAETTDAPVHPAPERSIETPPPPLTIASARPLGRTGLVVSPLVVSGANAPSVASLFRAMNDGCNAFFWEPRYRNLTTFLRAAGERGQRPLVVAGTYHATDRAIRQDVEHALRRLNREYLDVFLVFWTRSAARLEDPVRRTLDTLKREGLIRAAGFSTHDRALAEATIGTSPWDVVMIRHSAAHPGAEERLFQRAHDHGVGVLGFSATSYGRLLRRVPGSPAALPTAAECYRYSLSQRGVSACVSAPRGGRELMANLEVLREPLLADVRLEELRAQGRLVRDESLDFARHIRRFPTLPDADRLEDAIDEESDLGAEVPDDPMELALATDS